MRTSVTRMRTSVTTPTSGSKAMCCHSGTRAISAKAIPASEPSRPARGTQLRTAEPSGATSDLQTPTITSSTAPTCQAKNIA